MPAFYTYANSLPCNVSSGKVLYPLKGWEHWDQVSDTPDGDSDLSDLHSLLLFLDHMANKSSSHAHINTKLLSEDIYYKPIVPAPLLEATDTKCGNTEGGEVPHFQASGNKTICIQKPEHIK